ncbi:MAG: ABC-2 family transporter protein [Eubacterium sp.]|nr:ABC-2 family transporter protein [Eubacterium sp.]
MKKWKRYARLYVWYQAENVRSLAQYRADFLLMILFTVFSQGCSLALIGIIYSNIPAVGGWTMWEVLMLYGFLLFSEGSINFFFQGAWKIANMIREAELDRFLVRPVPVGLQLLAARIDFEGLNKMMIAGALLFLSAGRCGAVQGIADGLLLLAFLIQACIIRLCMVWIASCASFWMENGRNSLNYFVICLGEMAKYPLAIYPPVLKGIFGYLVPYAFVSYYPVGYLTGKSGMAAGAACIPFVCAGMVLVSYGVLKRGLCRYESGCQ